MSSYALTPGARIDVLRIWTYIAEDSESAADRVEAAIYEACEFIAAAPLRGHVRPDITPRPLRFWTLTRYPNYSIAYRPETAPTEIVAVLHGRRNLRQVMRSVR